MAFSPVKIVGDEYDLENEESKKTRFRVGLMMFTLGLNLFGACANPPLVQPDSVRVEK